jgi:hypothetical protein
MMNYFRAERPRSPMAARGATRAAGSHSVDRIVRIIFLVFGQDIFTTQKRSRNNFTDFLMLTDAKLYINISLLTYYI